MNHREAIRRLESLNELIEETLVTITYVPVRDGDEAIKGEAQLATVLMKAMWRSYQEALTHAIEQLGRMEGLEQ